MVAQYSDFQKFNEAKTIAKAGNCFITELKEHGTTVLYRLYRKGEVRNFFIGERKTLQALLSLVKKSCTVV